jgi:hypothetical protein
MIDIVVFGKPRSFESYEFEFDGHKEQSLTNTHLEPIIKPVDYNIPVFHYYKKDSIAGWEVYRRCRGFDSSRDGIVFGVGVKSDKDFDLIGSLTRYLIPFWEDFADAFLDSNKTFKIDSIIDRLKSTKWSSDEKEKVSSSIKEESIPDTINNDITLLLVAPDFSEIQKVENVIKTYSDVYIAGDATLFQMPINKTVLAKQANDEIHIINKGKIEKLSLKKPEEETSDNKPKKRTWNWIWSNDENSSSQQNSSDNDGKKKKKKTPSRLIAAILVLCLLVAAIYFIFLSKPSADRIELARPENGYIIDSFNLQPELFHGESKRTSTGLEDIEWKVEGNGRQYVEWNPQETYIKINKNYYQNKPRQETQVTVTARLGGKDLGKQTYKIREYQRHKANTITWIDYLEPIKNSLNLKSELSFNGETDVTTSLKDIVFEVSPSGFATVQNNTLIVNPNRPETSNHQIVTVTAKLDGEIIGSKTYSIAKKEPQSTEESPKGVIYYKIGLNDDYIQLSQSTTITSRNLSTAYFIAMENGKACEGGKWSFSQNIYVTSINNNPIRIDEIRATGKASLHYKKAGKTVATIQFNVKIEN